MEKIEIGWHGKRLGNCGSADNKETVQNICSDNISYHDLGMTLANSRNSGHEFGQGCTECHHGSGNHVIWNTNPLSDFRCSRYQNPGRNHNNQ